MPEEERRVREARGGAPSGRAPGGAPRGELDACEAQPAARLEAHEALHRVAARPRRGNELAQQRGERGDLPRLGERADERVRAEEFVLRASRNQTNKGSKEKKR